MVLGFVILSPALVSAADWKPLDNPASGFLDTASVRKDSFSTLQGAGYVMAPYMAAWLKFATQDGDVLTEVVFNCRGGFAPMQQIVAHDTPNSQYHSFDNTPAFRQIFVDPSVKDIAPDSAYETAEKIVCK